MMNGLYSSVAETLGAGMARPMHLISTSSRKFQGRSSEGGAVWLIRSNRPRRSVYSCRFPKHRTIEGAPLPTLDDPSTIEIGLVRRRTVTLRCATVGL